MNPGSAGWAIQDDRFDTLLGRDSFHTLIASANEGVLFTEP